MIVLTDGWGKCHGRWPGSLELGGDGSAPLRQNEAGRSASASSATAMTVDQSRRHGDDGRSVKFPWKVVMDRVRKMKTLSTFRNIWTKNLIKKNREVKDDTTLLLVPSDEPIIRRSRWSVLSPPFLFPAFVKHTSTARSLDIPLQVHLAGSFSFSSAVWSIRSGSERYFAGVERQAGCWTRQTVGGNKKNDAIFTFIIPMPGNAPFSS